MEISGLCGQREEQLDFTVFEQKPLISTSQLQHMQLGEALVISKENYPYKAKLIDISEYDFDSTPVFKKIVIEYPLNVPFDIQEFVKEKKRQELECMLQKNKESNGLTSTDEMTSVIPRSTTQLYAPSIVSDSMIEFPVMETVIAIDESEKRDMRHTQLLLSHYNTKAFDAYEMKDFETAEKYFTKIYYLDDNNEFSACKNNLAYMKRRGETKSLTVPITTLLDENTDGEQTFVLINLALCYLIGFDVSKDWTHTVELIRRINKNCKDFFMAVDWWNDSYNVGEKERNLVLLLLKAAQKLDSSTTELKERLEQAQKDGYDLPLDAINTLKYGF